MKKSVTFLLLFATLSGCLQPERRNWIIPLVTDPSDMLYTPVQSQGYEKRRDIALDSMKGGILVLKSTDQWSYNRHGFRPNNYFQYLSGWSAQGALLLMGEVQGGPYVLTMPYTNQKMEMYQGPVPTKDQVGELYEADRMVDYSDAGRLLDSILGSEQTVWADLSNESLVKDLERINGGPLKGRVRDAAAFLNEQRVIKDFMEVERLQKACNITAQALVDAMRECEPGQYEFETESVIEGTFLRYGSTMPGFPSILGSGPNSTILHYEQNTRKTEDGDLLLMDVGAEYGMYSADITRTIPVSGKFTRDQLMVYQLVLDAQKAAIEKMKPGNYFTDGQIAARKVLVRGLADLGLITDTTSPWQIRFYILHGFSHYLGMDVHDVGDMGGTFESFMQKIDQDIIESRILEPGMVLTIEPGLYFRPDGLKNAYKQLGSEADSAEIAAFTGEIAPVYERFINMGVRIEDDILVTPAGNICLSRYAPKEPGDIEQIMR